MRIPASALILVAALVAPGLACRRSGPATSLEVSGNIEAYPVEASFRVAGRVLERPVDEGMAVELGQVLARLDARDLEQSLAARQAEVATAKAALAAGLAGSRKEEVEASRALLTAAEADLRRLEPDLVRMEELHKSGAISKRDLDATRAACEASRAKVREATQRFALVQQGPRKEDLDQLRARFEQATQAQALAQTQLGHATLVSPVKGLALSRNIEPGEYVAPGTPVLTVADLTKVYLRAYIEETDLGRVKLGQAVEVRTDTWPGKVYPGKVVFLASEAEFTPKSVQTKKERTRLVYRVKLEVPNPALELKPGMPADARILLEK